MKKILARLKIGSFMSQYAIVFVLLGLITFFSLTLDTFLSVRNIANIFRQISMYGICSVGMATVIIIGKIDLSQGAVMAITGIVLAKLMLAGVHPVSACVVVLAFSPLIGIFNGIFVHEVKLHPLIATMATQQVLRSVGYLVSGGLPVFGFTRSFTVIGQGYVGFIPIPVIIMFVTFAAGYVFLTKTRMGRYIYGTGSNEEATKLSGVSVRKTMYTAFAISSFTASIAGVVMLSRVNSAQPYAAVGYETDIIIGSVLGGISMAGGEGNLLKVIFGVSIMGTMVNGMTMHNISEYYQMLLKGLVLLAAMTYDMAGRRRAERKI